MLLWIGLAALTIFLAYCLKRWSDREFIKVKNEKAIAKALQKREESMRKVAQSLETVPEQVRTDILALHFHHLIEALQTGKYSAKEVLAAYQQAALAAHERTNCVTEFINEATEWADQWDTKAAWVDFVKPPYFGLPISIKASIALKGHNIFRGYVKELDVISEEDALSVHHLKKLGAVPFVLTNVPQSLLSFSCSNPVFGATLNPHNATKTPGGSSGGEAALIGAKGCLLGLGSDVGGSIRLPCHFSGISGIKPSHSRISQIGSTPSVPGRPLVNASLGPMAVRIEHCSWMLRHFWSDQSICLSDPYTAPVKWQQHLYDSTVKPQLTIGYYESDGWFETVPALRRAVVETKRVLREKGHVLVPLDPTSAAQAFAHFTAAVSVDGGHYILDMLSDEPIDATISPTVNILRIPVVMRRFIAYLLRPIYPRLSRLLEAFPLNTSELRGIYAQIEKFRVDFTKQLRDRGIDAIICPPQAMAAVGQESVMRAVGACSYTSLFNLLDYAAGVVPVTRVNQQDIDLLQHYPVSDPWSKVVKSASADCIGLPVGVQCAVPPFREELCLRVLEIIQDNLSIN